jgi:hypothetical protein
MASAQQAQPHAPRLVSSCTFGVNTHLYDVMQRVFSLPDVKDIFSAKSAYHVFEDKKEGLSTWSGKENIIWKIDCPQNQVFSMGTVT